MLNNTFQRTLLPCRSLAFLPIGVIELTENQCQSVRTSVVAGFPLTMAKSQESGKNIKKCHVKCAKLDLIRMHHNHACTCRVCVCARACLCLMVSVRKIMTALMAIMMAPLSLSCLGRTFLARKRLKRACNTWSPGPVGLPCRS